MMRHKSRQPAADNSRASQSGGFGQVCGGHLH
ncbi:hypothetical protein BN439_3702 [Erwinia amylovora Ea644]|nr:hypothetical protein BN439_3702 [Erwinia amylovora Ea644]CCP08791.1 hypothetical protein BN440_3805 [Erwinia amylovora MR1]